VAFLVLKMMWKVYAIYSLVNQIIYVGMSQEPDERLRQHNAKKVKSTKAYAPWKRFFLSESIGNTIEARKLEKYYKSASG
jgi:putative endonuclease